MYDVRPTYTDRCGTGNGLRRVTTLAISMSKLLLLLAVVGGCFSAYPHTHTCTHGTRTKVEGMCCFYFHTQSLLFTCPVGAADESLPYNENHPWKIDRSWMLMFWP